MNIDTISKDCRRFPDFQGSGGFKRGYMEIYVVKPGDSVDSIARALNANAEQLIYDNQLEYPYELAVGQALLVSGYVREADRTAAVSGYAYPFIAKSGTGKSTHSNLWLKHIQGTELMNDDNPIIRIIDGKPFLYGSPWSGKTPCYKDIKAPLGAVTRIDRAPANSIERLRPVQAFASMLPSCSSMKWDSIIYNNICNIITRLVETVPMFTMHCLPDKEAALICHQGIAGSGS